MKDWLLGKVLRTYVRERIARYGELKDLSIDSQRKSLDVVVRPHGETEDVHVKVIKYSITETDGKHILVIDASTASRPWLTYLLEDYLHGRSFEIPPLAAVVL